MKYNVFFKVVSATLCAIFCFNIFPHTDVNAISNQKSALSEQAKRTNSLPPIYMNPEVAVNAGAAVIGLVVAAIRALDKKAVKDNRESEAQDGGLFEYSTTTFTVVSTYYHRCRRHAATAMIGYEVKRGEGGPCEWARAGLTHWYPTRHKKAFYEVL